MRKIFISLMILLFIFVTIISAEKIRLISDVCIRNSSDYKTSKTIGTAIKGTVFDVKGVFGDYILVKNEKGFKGWVDVHYLDSKDGRNYGIKGLGVSCWNLPKGTFSSNREKIGAFGPNEKLIKLDTKVTWYAITNGWVYAGGAEKVK